MATPEEPDRDEVRRALKRAHKELGGSNLKSIIIQYRGNAEIVAFSYSPESNETEVERVLLRWLLREGRPFREFVESKRSKS